MANITLDILKNSFFRRQIIKVIKIDGIDACITQQSIVLDDENYSLLLLIYGTREGFIDHIMDKLFYILDPWDDEQFKIWWDYYNLV